VGVRKSDVYFFASSIWISIHCNVSVHWHIFATQALLVQHLFAERDRISTHGVTAL